MMKSPTPGNGRSPTPPAGSKWSTGQICPYRYWPVPVPSAVVVAVVRRQPDARRDDHLPARPDDDLLAAAAARRAAGPGGASPPAGPGRPSAARTARSGCRGTAPRASRRAAPARCAVRPRTGRRRRTAASAAPARRAVPARGRPRARGWTTRGSRAAACGPPRPAGAARTSSSSCLIIVPIRITFAGCSTCAVIESTSSSGRRRPRPSAGSTSVLWSSVTRSIFLVAVTASQSARRCRPISRRAAAPCRCARWTRRAGAPRRRRRG